MEVSNKLYELTDNIDNIGLYDPEKRRREEEKLKIEYFSQLAEEKGIEQGIEKGANNVKNSIAKSMLSKKMDISLISELTGLSKKQITMLL